VAVDGSSNTVEYITNTSINIGGWYQNTYTESVTNTTETNATFTLVPDKGRGLRAGKAMISNWDFVGGFTNPAAMLYTGVAHKVDTYAYVDAPVSNTPLTVYRDNSSIEEALIIADQYNSFNNFGLSISQYWNRTEGTTTNTNPYHWGRWWGPPNPSLSGGTNDIFEWFSSETNVPFKMTPLDNESYADGWMIFTNVAIIWWDFKYK
jgi:hypothetical protein